MLLTEILVGATLCILIYILCSRWKYYKLMFEIPGPFGLPVVGMIPHLAKREGILYAFEKYGHRYGSVFYSWLGPMPFLVVSEPQIAEDILTSPHCVNKSVIYKSIEDGTGMGLFSLKNPQWSKHRKLLNPAFGHRVLLSFMPIFNEEINRLLESIDTLKEKGAVDLSQVFKKFTLNTAIRTTMGTLPPGKGQFEIFQHESILRSFACMLESLTEMLFSPWLNYKLIRKLLAKEQPYAEAKKGIRDFIRNLIQDKLQNESDSNINQRDDANADVAKDTNIFLNIAVNLLRRGDFTIQNVEAESNVIVFGAFETTANTIAYTLMLLSMYPEYQQKAFDEISSIFPDKGAFEVSYADIQQMVYMDMILNEAMRLMAPVPLVARETTNDVRLSTGVVLPKGIQVAINIFHMHRRKDIWGPAAHTFDPEHFLPSNLEGKHSFAFIPFTKGIRNCVGWRYALLSAKAALAKLIRNYRFTTEFNFNDLHFVEDITIKFRQMPLIEIHTRSI